MIPLFAESEGEGPAWAAGALAVVAVALGVVRLWFFLKKKRLENAEQQRTLDKSYRADETESQKEARRDAADEAWEVVDRLNLEIERLKKAEQEAEERARRCYAEHAETKAELGRLRGKLEVVIAWGQSKGLKMPPMDDTGAHRPIAPGSHE